MAIDKLEPSLLETPKVAVPLPPLLFSCHCPVCVLCVVLCHVYAGVVLCWCCAVFSLPIVVRVFVPATIVLDIGIVGFPRFLFKSKELP